MADHHDQGSKVSRRRLIQNGAAATLGTGLVSALPVSLTSRRADAASTLTIWGVNLLQKPVNWPAKFEASNPGIKVVYNTISSATADSTQKFVTAIAGGSPPDLIYIGRLWVGELAKQQALIPLDDRVAASHVVKAKDFFPVLWYDVHWGGKAYGIPIETDVRVFYWNKDLFKKAGLDPERPPRTWAEVEHFADKLTIRKNGTLKQLGFDPSGGNPPGFLAWYLYTWQLGGDFYSPDYRKATCNSKEVVQALTWMLHMADKYGGRHQLDAFSLSAQSTNVDAFGLGKLAMEMNGDFYVPILKQYAPHVKYGQAALPLPPRGHKTNYSGGFAWAIPKGAKNPDAAWKFIEFMTSPTPNVTYCNDIGAIPPTRSLANAPRFLNANPRNKLYVDQLPSSKWVLVGPGATQAFVLTSQAYDNAMNHRMSPQEACDQLNQQMQPVLDARYQ